MSSQEFKQRPARAEDVAKKIKVDLTKFLEVAKTLNMPKIYSKTSYVYPEQEAEIAASIKKENDAKSNKNNPNFAKTKTASNIAAINDKSLTSTQKEQPARAEDVAKKIKVDLTKFLEVAKTLNMPKIYSKTSYVYPEQEAEIAASIKKENDAKSNKNNPNFAKTKTASNIAAINDKSLTSTQKEQPARAEDVAKRNDVTLEKFLEVAKKIDIPSIFNSNSPVYSNQEEKIISCIKKENDTNVNKKPLNQPTTQFEYMISNNYLIFFDTSSLMNPNIFKVLENEVIALLKRYNKQVYIVDSVHKELEKKCKSDYETTRKQAENALEALAILSADGLYEVAETNSVHKNFADGELLSYFNDIRVMTNLCLVTNDNSIKNDGNLSVDILNLKNNKSVQTKFDVKVYYISQNKENPQLVKFEKDKDSNFKLHAHPPKRVKLF